MPRKVEPRDAPAVAELINAYMRELHGTADVIVDEVVSWWRDPEVEAWVTDDLGAYADLGARDGGTRLWIDLRGLRRARCWRPPRSGRARSPLPGPSSGPSARRSTHRSSPFSRQRNIPSCGAPSTCASTSTSPSRRPSGPRGSRCERSGDPDVGWVSILGVRPPWRGRGLGLALLRHAFREIGRPTVRLGVDAENVSGAVRLYERAGMRVERRFDTYEKPA